MNLKGKNFIILILVILCGILAGGIVYFKFAPEVFCSKQEENLISPQEAVKRALAYINENLLSGGVQAKLAGEVTEEEGLYKFQIDIEGQKFFSYVTKDGNLFFPQGFDLAVKKEKAVSGANQAESCGQIKKEKKPELEAFVVSFCPYGLQMQRILTEIVQKIPDLSQNIKIRYMGSVSGDRITSMHGDEEAKENLRQICIREEQPERYFSYIGCHIKKGEVESCLKEAGVDEEKLEACQSDKNRGLAYAKEDFSLQDEYGIRGSPTLILNGQEVSEFDFGGRTAEAVKNLLCCGFSKKPDICTEKLSENQAATGFSESYSSENSSGGSCE